MTSTCGRRRPFGRGAPGARRRSGAARRRRRGRAAGTSTGASTSAWVPTSTSMRPAGQLGEQAPPRRPADAARSGGARRTPAAVSHDARLSACCSARISVGAMRAPWTRRSSPRAAAPARRRPSCPMPTSPWRSRAIARPERQIGRDLADGALLGPGQRERDGPARPSRAACRPPASTTPRRGAQPARACSSMPAASTSSSSRASSPARRLAPPPARSGKWTSSRASPDRARNRPTPRSKAGLEPVEGPPRERAPRARRDRRPRGDRSPTIRPEWTGSASSPASKNSVSGFSMRISPRERCVGRSVERGPRAGRAPSRTTDSGCARRRGPLRSRRRPRPRREACPGACATERTPWKRTSTVAGCSHSSAGRRSRTAGGPRSGTEATSRKSPTVRKPSAAEPLGTRGPDSRESARRGSRRCRSGGRGRRRETRRPSSRGRGRSSRPGRT